MGTILVFVRLFVFTYNCIYFPIKIAPRLRVVRRVGLLDRCGSSTRQSIADHSFFSTMARKQLHFGLATTAGSRYAGLNQDVAFKAQRALGGGPSATTSPFASPRGRYGDQLLSSSQPNHSQPLIRHSRSASASPPPPQPRPARPPTCHIWYLLFSFLYASGGMKRQ